MFPVMLRGSYNRPLLSIISYYHLYLSSILVCSCGLVDYFCGFLHLNIISRRTRLTWDD
jgi:hypothetical protein